MHKTLLDDVKFHLDHFDYSEGTYFLAGWLHSTGKPIVSLRVEALNKFSEETHQFEMRHDVNKFYNLPENTLTGFKFVLTPETKFLSLLFSIKREGEDNFKVIKDIGNSHVQSALPTQAPSANTMPKPQADLPEDNASSNAQGHETQQVVNRKPKTVCWNAIVKNEARIIERCMESMVGEIDYWLVVDTGSTDGTQDIIRAFMEKRGIPGELIERPWKNFSFNRSEALELAENKADYILFCDADMALEVIDKDWKYQLAEGPAYLVNQKAHSDLVYSNIRLVKGRLKGDERFRYWGATHEYCDSIEPYDGGHVMIHTIMMQDFGDGGSKSDKFERDARMLTEQIKELKYLQNDASEEERKIAWDRGLLRRYDLLNTRCTFYLAQTWRDHGSPEMALATYIKRSKMVGWFEETWYAVFQIALLKQQLKYPNKEIMDAYLEAYGMNPSRAESLYSLAKFLRKSERYELGYVYALAAANIPLSTNRLFVSTSVYDWKAKDELAICAYQMTYYTQSRALCEELTVNPNIPEGHLNRIKNNLQIAVDAIENHQQ